MVLCTPISGLKKGVFQSSNKKETFLVNGHCGHYLRMKDVILIRTSVQRKRPINFSKLELFIWIPKFTLIFKLWKSGETKILFYIRISVYDKETRTKTIKLRWVRTFSTSWQPCFCIHRQCALRMAPQETQCSAQWVWFAACIACIARASRVWKVVGTTCQ